MILVIIFDADTSKDGQVDFVPFRRDGLCCERHQIAKQGFGKLR